MKIYNLIPFVPVMYLLSACSVEDPYETGPTQAQQEEQKQQQEQQNQTRGLTLQLLDSNDAALTDASVQLFDNQYRTDAQGKLTLADLNSDNITLTISVPGYERIVMVVNSKAYQDQPLPVVLKEVSATSSELMFGGDTMFGRRYMDPSLTTMGNLLPDVEDAMIRPGNAASSAIALTQFIKPIMASADFASVNLESPVLATPTTVHPSKEFAFFSLPDTLQGLTAIGIDYVALGNNHVFDYQQKGLEDTIKFVEQAGFSHSGAGNNTTEAYAPRLVKVGNTTLALVSATSITGEDHQVTYIATADKGGAADLTDSTALSAAVEQASDNSDYAIVQLHGGDEYSYAPTRYINNRFEFVSRRAPDLMIAHHPHVAQGFGLYNGVPALLGLGNFVFEQNRHETLLGVAVSVRIDPTQSPKTQSARAYPIYLEDYQPKLVSGFLSDYLIRRLAEFSSPEIAIVPGPGYGDVYFQQPPTVQEVETVTLNLAAGDHLVDLREYAPSNAFLSKITSTGTADVTLGRDLMWFGDFEDWDNDNEVNEVTRWEHESDDITPCLTGAMRGTQGMCLSRTQFNNRPIRMPFKQTLRTMPITPAESTLEAYSELTLFGYAKGDNAGALDAELTIVTAEDNLEFSSEEVGLINSGSYDWQTFRHDITLPDDSQTLGPEQLPARAVKLAIKQAPPEQGEATVMLDQLALISWQKSFSLNNRLWQADRMHGLDFMALETDDPVTLTLHFSAYD
ncbi:capsule biosynthesis protein CapA [Pseudoalteromonas rubra]|uniref:Capsule biosynthesis protein CapA n=1 Tax=Pseudoalteromonas rubra TaxID=43658 RepID=A0A5S3WPL9_9GAMM|nr:CapA family protein [Pseudoalteromonas rubra]TMP30330.1 capsule biosynthesis protein CapA [Pseudoalteromonas rubra]TMP35353.1 capsule biosynthesis protein CapA [Pseudoalteromonas rubra]